MNILVTGAAGFIGSKVSAMLLADGHTLTGIDNINDYYDTRLKRARLKHFFGIMIGEDFPYGASVTSATTPRMRFVKGDITDDELMHTLFAEGKHDIVINLAAQAGVRHSINHPRRYVRDNIMGFLNVLEGCREFGVKHLVYASSSSIYGLNSRVPYTEADTVSRPTSIYAATKLSDEAMAHAYSLLYGLPTSALRYFTVYGPWGRPDMAPMLFADAITRGKEIKVFNNGDMARDFTYIDDVARATADVAMHTPAPNADHVPYEIYNVGCSHPVSLDEFISKMEQTFGMEAIKKPMPMQPGDVPQTYADTTKLHRLTGPRPFTDLARGLQQFAQWFRSDQNPLS